MVSRYIKENLSSTDWEFVFVFGPHREYTAPSGAKKTFPDEWYESVIPVSTFSEGHLKEVRFYPLVIESSATPTDGFLRLAVAAQAQRVGTA